MSLEKSLSQHFSSILHCVDARNDYTGLVSYASHHIVLVEGLQKNALCPTGAVCVGVPRTLDNSDIAEQYRPS